MRTVEPGDICENDPCDHTAVGLWVGNGGSLAITRNYMQHKWCACCMTKAQIKHAQEMADRLYALRAQLLTECSET